MKVEWKSCFKVVASAFLLFLSITYWASFTKFVGTLFGAAMPLIIGCVIAYILNIMMSYYERHYFPNSKKSGILKSRRPVCMLASFVTLTLIGILLARIVIPELTASVDLLIAKVPESISSLLVWLEEAEMISEDTFDALRNADWRSRTEQIM